MTLLKLNGAPVKRTYSSLFEDFWTGLENTGSPKSGSAPVNIHETKDAFHLELSAPGLKKEDFNINVEADLLTISYDKKEEAAKEDYKTVRKEFIAGSFKRSFTLSDKVNASDIQGKYEDGILKVFLPKKPEAQAVSKQINIQ